MKRHGIICLAALLAAATSGEAMSFTFSDATHAAFADFSVVGGNLQITLANTFAGNTAGLADVLTGVFFSGANGLTPMSAVVPMGSTEWIQTAGTVLGSALSVGGDWQYKSGLTGLPGGGTAGISSAGLGIFGPSGNFGSPSVKLGGAGYGLVSAGYLGLAQGGLGNLTEPVFEYSAIFTLSGLGAGFDPGNISNVYFQYGTALAQTSVPDGASTAVLVGLALAACSMVGRKRARS